MKNYMKQILRTPIQSALIIVLVMIVTVMLVAGGKGAVDAAVTPEQKEAQKTKNEAFQKEIKYNDNSLETVEGEYLLHGIKRIETTNVPDMMRTMDREAYSEYEKTLKRNDGGVSSLKYLINWYTGAVEKNPSLVAEYEKQLKFSRNI